MANQKPRRRITFVTGINENYFLLACQLMDSLEEHLPLIPLRIMDFGLSEGQQEYFRRRGVLMPMPPGVPRDAHSFVFKSSIGSLFTPELGTPVWIDADIIAVADGTQAMHDLAASMEAEGQRFALAPDCGLPDGAGHTLSSFCARYPCANTDKRLAAKPEMGARPYLNTGFIMFREGDRLDDWRETAAALAHDTVWEQNAMNVLCYDGTARARQLDARSWNAHGSLLEKLVPDGAGYRCDGAPLWFVHATSPFSQLLEQGQVNFDFGPFAYSNFFKFFTYPALRQWQWNFIERFVSNNHEEMRELGIL